MGIDFACACSRHQSVDAKNRNYKTYIPICFGDLGDFISEKQNTKKPEKAVWHFKKQQSQLIYSKLVSFVSLISN